MRWQHDIPSVVSWPRGYNLTLTTRKHRRSVQWAMFATSPDLCSSTMSTARNTKTGAGTVPREGKQRRCDKSTHDSEFSFLLLLLFLNFFSVPQFTRNIVLYECQVYQRVVRRAHTWQSDPDIYSTGLAPSAVSTLLLTMLPVLYFAFPCTVKTITGTKKEIHTRSTIR